MVLLERPAPNKLPPELETYLTTHTYIDARRHADEMETIRKRIWFAMPKVPRETILVRLKIHKSGIVAHPSTSFLGQIQ